VHSPEADVFFFLSRCVFLFLNALQIVSGDLVSLFVVLLNVRALRKRSFSLERIVLLPLPLFQRVKFSVLTWLSRS